MASDPCTEPAELHEDVDLDMERRRYILDAHAQLDEITHYALLGIARSADRAVAAPVDPRVVRARCSEAWTTCSMTVPAHALVSAMPPPPSTGLAFVAADPACDVLVEVRSSHGALSTRRARALGRDEKRRP
jgi:hypothetical protein